jgi:nucleotide-binding universal stress UspA family protein
VTAATAPPAPGPADPQTSAQPEAPATLLSETTAPVFRRALVALAGGPGDERIVRMVSELAKPAHAELTAVHVVEIGWALPLDADVAGRSEEVQQILDAAEAVAEDSRITLEAVLLQARDVGAALVDEATERDADLLVLGLPYRKRFGGDFAIGRTIPYVLKNAPCTVWVVREPIPEDGA